MVVYNNLYINQAVIQIQSIPCFQLITNNIKQSKMKRNARHNSTSKMQNTLAINILQDKLFSKLHKMQTETGPISSYQDLHNKLLKNTPDSLTDLIFRAKGITTENHDKIEKAKRKFKISKKQATGTFLTGTGLYAVQDQEKRQINKQPQIEIDAQQMLKNITKKGEYDDLAELRRMIRITDENLGVYEKQMHQSKKDVMNAASQFKSQMNFQLSYKLNRLQQPKKTKSVAKLKQLRHV